MYSTCDSEVALAIHEQCCNELVLRYLIILDVHLFCSSNPLLNSFVVFTGHTRLPWSTKLVRKPFALRFPLTKNKTQNGNIP